MRWFRWTSWAVVAALGGAAHAGEACNATLGKQVFETKCVACHAMGAHKVGPRLDRLVGRKVGSAKGFEYSPAMAALSAKGFKWDEARLDAFLTDPQAYAPGTAMAFRGLQAKDERSALVCFVKQQ